MIRKILLTLSLSILGTLSVLADDSARIYREAMHLYDNGMYSRAESLFRSLGRDPLYEGYAILCAGKMKQADFVSLLSNYEKAYRQTELSSALHYQLGTNFFDEKKYSDALVEFAKVRKCDLKKKEHPALIFKRGFCNFAQGRYPEAQDWFSQLVALPASDYTAPAGYALGYMAYTRADFKEAETWFSKSVKDARLKDISAFYLVDCRFLMKDYDYVIENGVPLYERMPKARQARLSRIISESYLVRGAKEKAREFYERDVASRRKMTNTDYFYAGSLMYANDDYKGAIENFSAMTVKSDSLWQIAAYHLGNCHLQQRNKVEAMKSFAQAAALDFDAGIKEDASFNHAKLAFDINSDGTYFEEYLKHYGTTAKGERIYGYMALSRLANRDYVGAIEAYDKISAPDSDQDRNYLKANYLRAVELVNTGAWKDAVDYLRSATLGQNRHDNFCQLAKYWLAECDYRSGDYKAAMSGFVNLYNLSALDGEPEGARLSYNAAYSAFMLRDYTSSAKWFDRCLSDGDASLKTDALVRRADCDFALKDYTNAITQYQKAVDAAGDSASVYSYYQLAMANGLLGTKNGRAKKVEILKKVESSFPHNAPMYSTALYELGSVCLDSDDNAGAVRYFGKLKSVSTDVNDQEKADLGCGMAYVNMKKYEKALQCYKAVVSRQGKDSELGKNALQAIESIYTELKTPQKYLEYLESCGAMEGASVYDRDSLYFNVAKQNFNAGNIGLAQKSLLEYVRDFPLGKNVPSAWYYIGECYAYGGEKEPAIGSMAKAVDLLEKGELKETAVRRFAELSLEVQHYREAYDSFDRLYALTSYDETRHAAVVGMMKSAYGARDYENAIKWADALKADAGARFIKAKSCLAVSRRDEALPILESLAKSPSTDIGAEANYLLIQDRYDRGEFSKISGMVFDFAPKATGQDYWLARAFVVLADSYVEQGNYRQAMATYESLIESYKPAVPDDIRPSVQERMEHLKTLMK